MQPDQAVVDDLLRERVERARAMSPEEKLLAGPRLFERSCRIMADGLRHEHPEASEEQIQELLRQRLELVRKLEEGS